MKNEINDGGPAFPHSFSSHSCGGAGGGGGYVSRGMTLRDYFAANAMAALVRRWDGHSFGGGPESPQYKELADDAFYIADAMLRARGKA